MRNPLRTASVGVIFGFGKRAQVPLAKMARSIAVFLQQLSQRELLRLHMT